MFINVANILCAGAISSSVSWSCQFYGRVVMIVRSVSEMWSCRCQLGEGGCSQEEGKQSRGGTTQHHCFQKQNWTRGHGKIITQAGFDVATIYTSNLQFLLAACNPCMPHEQTGSI